MGYKGNKKNWFLHILRSFTSLFCGKDVKTSTKASAPSVPEATMVAAAKHFSSAHKVKFN
ncbi:hypothetical protein Lalb_Chr04g0255411 [Lupinus albus]|uniref:Uncharacterized protein n=1 Tax=Lupinus albus TaxID=3870 RepID=A0A6A4QLI0_LUPAL|nr:hypothetical protein Lalb_Chr04g0255411 [Lupinus albus]